MQYVNDDMDELFRSAAENYPLDTRTADWDKVLAALQGQTETKTISEKKRDKNGRFLWLLLLLPLGFVCNQLYSPGILNNNGISKTDAKKENPFLKKKNSEQQDYNKNNSASKTIVGVTGLGTKDQNTQTGTTNVDPSIQLQKTFYFSKASHSKGNTRNYITSDDVFSDNQMKNGHNNDNELINEDVPFSRSYVSEIRLKKAQKERSATEINRNLIPLITSTEQTSKQNIRVERRKKFYAGFMGGIDATTIKFQKIENAGFGYGLLFGYQFNKKWSIETGVYTEKKYYYSEGKYFNTSKIYMPSGSRIEDVSGDCKMYEVPVSVKYNFSSHKNSEWFATLGTSSYFMKKENYDYNYYYGTVGPVLHHKEYYNSTNNFFSNVSISGGYTHRIGNFADLRIEPYLKIPVSGMGIGSLPLFSTGLQAGLTKKF